MEPRNLSLIMLAMALALGTIMLAYLSRAEAEQRCVLFLHQDGAASDSSGLVEAAPSDLRGSVDIVLNGATVATTARGGFAHAFVPRKDANALHLKGDPAEAVEIKVVRLGVAGKDNVVLWQKTISPAQMKQGVECAFGFDGTTEPSEEP